MRFGDHCGVVLVMQACFDAGVKVALNHFPAHHFEHPAAGRATGQCLPHPHRIGTGRATEVQRLGNRLNGGDHHHLVARLGHLPGAAVTDMHDLLAEQIEERPHALEHRRLAADHDRQRRGDGALLTAGDRSIEHVDAVQRQTLRQRTRHFRRDGAHVDEDRAGGKPFGQAVRAEGHLLDVGSGGNDREHHL